VFKEGNVEILPFVSRVYPPPPVPATFSNPREVLSLKIFASIRIHH
jgi:hypothetical protein